MFHNFSSPISHIDIPRQFTFPFNYKPHPLCVVAAEELQCYIKEQAAWGEELSRGKMFGVIVVRTKSGKLGYLAAFSGNVDGHNLHSHFVPPIYDLLKLDGFFRVEEANISDINLQIEVLKGDVAYIRAKELLQINIDSTKIALDEAKIGLKSAKKARAVCRAAAPRQCEIDNMISESQHMKAEYKRLEERCRVGIMMQQTVVDSFEIRIDKLKMERKNRSAKLQRRLFDNFQILNSFGEPRGLCSIFEDALQKLPPAGAGECAAPKLLQYAYKNGLYPVAMAEFWWGSSPKGEVRHNCEYYPSCSGKCKPILEYMLQGVDVEDNPLVNSVEVEIDIVFEDEWLLVVNKGEGVLTVPGKSSTPSIYRSLSECYPEATGPLIVHRLDMATSGLIVVAKSKEVHKSLQEQFEKRTVVKRYIALLDGIVVDDSGVINLPLSLNPNDRPRQMVNEEGGKKAVTNYKIIERHGATTRVALYPITGRTHQLRLHMAHAQGLNAPIVGDGLYGRAGGRLHLHAEYLEFSHPITGRRVHFKKESKF